MLTSLPPSSELFHLTGSLKGAVHEWEAATPREALGPWVANDTGTTPPVRQWDPGGWVGFTGAGSLHSKQVPREQVRLGRTTREAL